MNDARRNKRAFFLLLAFCLLLTGCMSAPPEDLIRKGGDDQRLISASTGELAADTNEIKLYFRYGHTNYLAPEKRAIQVQRNESLEKAIVLALIKGPQVSASVLSPLFPAGTEVLAAVTQGDTLFITFNDSFLGRYADEPADPNAKDWKTEGPLRRQLCLDALTATLTEAGLCARVQVLVYQGVNQSTSMRLQAGFLTRSQDDSLLPAMRRSEDRLLTPHNTADLIMRAWMAQDWETLYDLTAREGTPARPGEQTAFDAFAAGQALTGFDLSCGSVSYDGQTAVITAQLTLRGTGRDQTVAGYPLLLTRESGLWKVNYARLIQMMAGEI